MVQPLMLVYHLIPILKSILRTAYYFLNSLFKQYDKLGVC